MDRFDKAFGIDGWENDFEIIEKEIEIDQSSEKKKKMVFICSLRVFTSNGVVSKSDGAEESDIDPTKGGFSNSMKRAATHWGIGRDLYKYPRVMLMGTTHRFISDGLKKKLRLLTEKIISGKPVEEIIYFKEADNR